MRPKFIRISPSGVCMRGKTRDVVQSWSSNQAGDAKIMLAHVGQDLDTWQDILFFHLWASGIFSNILVKHRIRDSDFKHAC